MKIDFDDSEFNASALCYFCDSEIELTWAHNLLIYENMRADRHVNIYWLTELSRVGRAYEGRKEVGEG